MTEEQIKAYEEAAKTGKIPDSENPLFLFQLTSDELLKLILAKEIDVMWLAQIEMINRGLDDNGNWTGFKR